MNRWFYVLICGLINICIGNVYAWSVFRKPAEQFFSITAKESGLPFMVFLACFAVTMPLSGRFLDKYSPKLFALLGGIIFSFGYILSGFTDSIHQIVLSYGVISGLGVGIIYGTTIAVPAKWIPEKKGLAVGLSVLGFGISPVITSYLSHFVIEMYGFLDTFKILGSAYMVVIFILAVFLKFPNKQETNYGNIHNPHEHASPSKLLRDKYFYTLWLCFLIGSFTGLSAISISSPFLMETTGIAPGQAALVISFLAIFNGLGRPVFGYLTDKFGYPKTIQLSFAIIIGSSILLLSNEKHVLWISILGLALLWSCLGGWLALAPTATNSIFGATHYSSNYGIVFTAYGIGALLGVYSSSSLRDTFGHYSNFFYPVIILCSLASLLAYFVFMRKKQGEKT